MHACVYIKYTGMKAFVLHKKMQQKLSLHTCCVFKKTTRSTTVNISESCMYHYKRKAQVLSLKC